ncbi:MAG: hypothetical protein DMF53_21805 [Acidobacteria bacterium]|nr:MAG: hypothetical protein DMF53_21805 [Acidobacteriota bacterium]
MFVGHEAIGLAGRAKTPWISLGTWLMAVQFLDLLWPIFLLLGWEHVRIAPGITKLCPFDFYDYPISHSLVGALGWSVVFAVGYLFLGRSERALRSRGALLLGAGVFSHWLLDLIVHRRDLPILPHGPYVGLGLWKSTAELWIEGALYVAGIALYLRATRSRDAIGRWGLWVLLVLMAAMWLSGPFSPPPSDVRTLAWGGLVVGWLIPLWGWWVDRHRARV